MKSMFVVCLFLSVSAFASEVTVMQLDGSRIRSTDEISTKMLVDRSTGEGSVQLTVQRRMHRNGGRYNEGYETVRTILRQEARVEGLYLQGDKLMFNNRTECGTYGVSRVFRIPTLYLTGRCDTSVRRSFVNGYNVLNVNFVTR
ncbi:MAG TPA: hypothetical protein VNJ08_08740 [Bacteriovoracaceae bacterium]|nr:hypothetical protein [Bacteriovoracaceae bacterium]